MTSKENRSAYLLALRLSVSIHKTLVPIASAIAVAIVSAVKVLPEPGGPTMAQRSFNCSFTAFWIMKLLLPFILISFPYAQNGRRAGCHKCRIARAAQRCLYAVADVPFG